MTLKEWLAAENITQKAFAERIQRSTATVSRLVNGNDLPSRETAIRIHRETGGPGDADGFSRP